MRVYWDKIAEVTIVYCDKTTRSICPTRVYCDKMAEVRIVHCEKTTDMSSVRLSDASVL